MEHKFDYKTEKMDPRWQRKSRDIMERDQYTCKICGRKDETLHVHHLYYDSALHYWEYPNDTLVCLCATCHTLAHNETVDTNLKWDRLVRAAECADASTLRGYACHVMERIEAKVFPDDFWHFKLYDIKEQVSKKMFFDKIKQKAQGHD